MRLSAALDLSAWRGRAPVWVGLTAMVALSWLYLAHMHAGPSGMVDSMAHHATGTKGVELNELLAAFVMWSVMMVAMMLPTAVPAVSRFLMLASRRNPAQAPAVTTALYVAGYLATWIGYSVPAALAQQAFMQAALLTTVAASASVLMSALILLAAGIFQFTPLKTACLTKCRSPLAFFLAEWRDGKAGAFVLGLRHGSYCLGCCWVLMAVLFVVGVMNLAWMALLTAFLLGEKVAPARWHLSRISGGILIAWGIWIAAGHGDELIGLSKAVP